MSQPLKFILQKDIQAIFNHFTTLFDIRIAFFSAQGDEINVGDNRPICQYCSLLRSQLDLDKTCLKLDQLQRENAAQSKKMVVYQCHAGMTEAVTPIFLDETLVGYIMIGQFRIAGQSQSQPVLIRWKNKFGTDELERSYDKTPCYASSQVNHILGLFDLLVNYIISQHMIRRSEPEAIQMLLDYIEGHIDENLTIAQAASLVCMSESSLSHKFKAHTGRSFKQYLIQRKLDRADRLLKQVPRLTIREIAANLGYADPLYFSRLYSRHRGCSPRSRIR